MAYLIIIWMTLSGCGKDTEIIINNQPIRRKKKCDVEIYTNIDEVEFYECIEY
jgi:hypothetical protein